MAMAGQMVKRSAFRSNGRSVAGNGVMGIPEEAVTAIKSYLTGRGEGVTSE
jgi:hypothetical protein